MENIWSELTDLQLCPLAEETEKASSEEIEPDMKRRADVIVSEIFDSELLGEGLLPSMRDAQLRLLAPGGTVIPARAVIWGQLIQSTILHRSTASTLPASNSNIGYFIATEG